jgi:HAD superfamily hydrolase (TIGR01484 family)
MTQILATDLDGTLIPWDDNPQHSQDLQEIAKSLKSRQMQLAFVTGRHLKSVADAIDRYRLPQPDWVLCDVGTSIYRVNGQKIASAGFESSAEYAEHLQQITGGLTTSAVEKLLSKVDGLRRQEQEKQTQFKLSYYARVEQMENCLAKIANVLQQSAVPYSVISSVDPFTGDGLIDLLPENVSKAYALDWWCQQHGYDRESIIYAGDSGNDLAAFSAGFRSILVGNTNAKVIERAKSAHATACWTNRIYVSAQTATSGVLDGLRHYFQH